METVWIILIHSDSLEPCGHVHTEVRPTKFWTSRSAAEKWIKAHKKQWPHTGYVYEAKQLTAWEG